MALVGEGLFTILGALSSTAMPAKRSRRPALEDQLAELSALRHELASPEALEKLRTALASGPSLLAAKAAKIVAEQGRAELGSELVAAFERFMTDPSVLDRGCIATKAIVEALVDLELPAPEVFKRGIRHVQLEGSYPDPNDVAIELRGNSAIGLANTGGSDTVLDLLPLLLDKQPPVRVAAARAIGACGRLEAEAVLRLKALVGDQEPEVIAECLSALVRLAPERSFELLQSFLHKDDPTVRQAAMLALGESRREEAVELLIEQWAREVDRETRRTLLLALASSRREAAFDFLLELVAEGDLLAAGGALEALAILRHDPKIRERAATAVERSSYRKDLRRRLEREF